MGGTLWPKFAQIYNYLSGKLINSFNKIIGNEKSEWQIAFTQDGSRIILLETKQLFVKVWDVYSGDLQKEFYLDKNPVNVELLSLSPKGEFLYFLSGGNIEIWSVDKEELIKSIPFDYDLRYDASIYCSTDEDNLIFIDDEYHIKVLNIEDGEVIRDFYKAEHEPNKIVNSPNGKLLISISSYNQPYIWDVGNDSLISGLSIDNFNVGGVAQPVYISNNGEFISLLQSVSLYCSKYAEMPIVTSMLMLYDRIEEKQLRTIPDGFVGVETPEILLSPDGTRLLVRGDKREEDYYKKIYIWDTENEEVLYRLEDLPNIMSFTPNGNQLLYAIENKLMFFDLESQAVTDSIVTYLDTIRSIKFSPSNELFMIRDGGNTAIYEFASRKLVYSFPGFIHGFTRDEDYGYSYSRDFGFSIVQLSTGDVVRTVTYSHEADVRLLDVSEFGEYYLAGTYKKLFVRNVETGDTLYNIEMSPSWAWSARFMIDHKHLFFWEKPNPTKPDEKINYSYNLETGKRCNLADGNLIFSSDRMHYAFTDCPGQYGYQALCDGFVSVEEDGERIISDNKLSVYPNPFDQFTIINYELTIPGNVVVKVYDVLGNEVAVLVNEYQGDGSHSTVFDAASHPEGMYYYTISIGDKVKSGKMVLVR